MDYLVRRLLCYADLDDAVYHPWVYKEAADRIEALENVLRQIAEGDRYSSDGSQFHIGYWGEFARAALGEKKDAPAIK